MRTQALAALLLLAPLPAAAQAIAVTLDQAVRVSLPREARDVIIGNPAIADANVLDTRHIVLTGKAIGMTNLVVTDHAGRTMISREVVTVTPVANRVIVFRGPDVASYACVSRCERAAAAAGGAAAPAPATP
jgi:Flp pilus assembly secretin CpaC